VSVSRSSTLLNASRSGDQFAIHCSVAHPPDMPPRWIAFGSSILSAPAVEVKRVSGCGLVNLAGTKIPVDSHCRAAGHPPRRAAPRARHHRRAGLANHPAHHPGRQTGPAPRTPPRPDPDAQR
jgi:hypothetical protein